MKAQKQAVKHVSSTMKKLFPFHLMEDHIEAEGKYVFFLRVHPPNMGILSKLERKANADKFQQALDGIDVPFSIFIMDKAENLEVNKKHYKACRSKWPDYDFVFNGYLQKLDSIDGESASVQRAFYLVVPVRDRQRFDLFAQQFQNRLDCTLAKRDELETIMRNFNLREYVTAPVYCMERELEKREPHENLSVYLSRERKKQYAATAANESLMQAVGQSRAASPQDADAGHITKHER